MEMSGERVANALTINYVIDLPHSPPAADDPTLFIPGLARHLHVYQKAALKAVRLQRLSDENLPGKAHAV